MMLAAPMAWAQSAYRIQPGDTLDVSVIEDPSLNRQTLVTPDGRISLPLAGVLRAGGLTIEQVQRSLANALSENFASRPNVFVSVVEITPEEEELEVLGVFVMGEVASPGRIEVEPGTTLLQALAMAGGPTRFAATKRVQWRRTNSKTGEQLIAIYNYRDIVAGKIGVPLRPLRAGDVIVVPERRLFE